MLQITKNNTLPFGVLGAKTPEEVQVDRYHRRYASHLVSQSTLTKRRNRPANPGTPISDIVLDSSSRTTSDADDGASQDKASAPNTKPLGITPVTSAIHRAAKNHTAVVMEVAHKAAKHLHPNHTIISTSAFDSRENGNEYNTQATPSATTTVTSVETGHAIANTTRAPIRKASTGVPPSTLYIIIGTGALALLILGLCIWAFWGKRRRDIRRRSTWRRATKGSKSDPFENSSVDEVYLEKPKSRDATMLNSIRGKRLRGGSPRKRAREESRESALWGSRVEFDGYPLTTKYPDTEKDKETSLYEALDFGPMSTFEATHSPVLTLPPIAHHPEANHDYVSEGTGCIGIDGSHNKHFPPASMNGVQQMWDSESKIQTDKTRREKDITVGLTDAYGTIKSWDEAEPNFSDLPINCPTELRPLKPYLPRQHFSNLVDRETWSLYATKTANLSVPPPSLAVDSSRHIFPGRTSITFVPPGSSATSDLMGLFEASKELEHIVNRLGKHSPAHSSSVDRGNRRDQLASEPPAFHESTTLFSDTSLSSALPYLDSFPRDPVPRPKPSEAIETVSTISPGAHSCDVADYTRKTDDPAGVTPNLFSLYSELWPSTEGTQKTGGNHES